MLNSMAFVNVLRFMKVLLSVFLGVKPQVLYAYNTYQFSDYSKFESSIFNEEEKAAYRQKVFPQQCEEAYQIGRSLIL